MGIGASTARQGQRQTREHSTALHFHCCSAKPPCKMKMPYSSNPTESPGRRRENGMAVIVVISLLAIILIYLAGNMRCLNLLKRDLTLIDRQQTRRLAAAP